MPRVLFQTNHLWGGGILPYKRCSLFNIRYITVTYLGSFAKITYLPKSDSDRSIESVICHRIYYTGVGALRGQRHIPSKCCPKYPGGQSRGSWKCTTRGHFFLCGGRIFSYYVLFIHNTFIFKRKDYRAF